MLVFNITVPFNPGRTDATDEQTDAESFDVLKPEADGFRNYLPKRFTVSDEEMLIDRAQLLTLTATRNDRACWWFTST